MENNKTMNPTPLGLLGFGLTTILLNIHNAGFIPLSMVILAMGVAMGGTAQIIAGVLSFKKGNTFAGTAFTSYGLFWFSLVLIWVFDSNYGRFNVDKISMGYYLLLWGIFTVFMAIGTKNHTLVSKIVFWSLATLFIVLAIGDFMDSDTINTIAGFIGIISGGSAFYDAVAQIVNEELNKTVLPLDLPKK